MAKYDDTKFYWLQLKEDFFDEGAIDWLEEQPNGKEYSLFYLKLCLKSLRTNGILERHIGSIIVPYDYKKLAEITNTNPDTVLIALDLFIKLELIEKLDTGALYMKEVENMIGSQSIGAFKKQQQRELARNKKLLLEGGEGAGRTSVHLNVHENIDIEKELELEKDIDNNVAIEDKATTTTKKKTSTRFVKPTVEEIAQYCAERNNGLNAQKIWDYYESKGWVVGKNAPMKDWRSSVRTWENNRFDSNKKVEQQAPQHPVSTSAEFEKASREFAKFEVKDALMADEEYKQLDLEKRRIEMQIATAEIAGAAHDFCDKRLEDVRGKMLARAKQLGFSREEVGI